MAISTYLSWANWRDGIMITERWDTPIFVSRNNTETRKSLRDRPKRSLDYSTLFAGQIPTEQAWAMIQSRCRAREYMPLICDMSEIVTANASKTLYCDTEYRNFQVGYYVVVAHIAEGAGVGYAADQDNIQFFPMLIESVNASSIVVVDTFPEQIEVGDLVFPAILSEISFDGDSLEIYGPNIGVLDMNIEEVYASTTLPLANSSYAPTEYDGYPFIDLDINWTETPTMSTGRPANVFASGRYQVHEFRTDNTAASFSILVSALNRAATWNLRGQLEYMMGMYKIFWFKSLLDTLTVVPTDALDRICLTSVSGSDNLDLVKGLYIENAAGEFDFRTGTMQYTGPTSDLVGYWPMDEGTGTTTEDSTGSGNDVTLLLTPSWVAGISGNALQFDGSTQYGTFNNPLLSCTSFTISVWVKKLGYTQYGSILSDYLSTMRNLILGYETPEGTIRLYVGSGSTSATTLATGFTQDVWHHIVGLFDVANDRLDIYIDNVKTEGSVGSVTSMGAVEYNARFARYSAYSFNGIIDELRMYNRALSDEEITALYNSPGGSPEFVYNNATPVEDVTVAKQAFLVRSSRDDFPQEWFSPNVMEVPLDLVEVTEAYSV